MEEARAWITGRIPVDSQEEYETLLRAAGGNHLPTVLGPANPSGSEGRGEGWLKDEVEKTLLATLSKAGVSFDRSFFDDSGRPGGKRASSGGSSSALTLGAARKAAAERMRQMFEPGAGPLQARASLPADLATPSRAAGKRPRDTVPGAGRAMPPREQSVSSGAKVPRVGSRRGAAIANDPAGGPAMGLHGPGPASHDASFARRASHAGLTERSIASSNGGVYPGGKESAAAVSGGEADGSRGRAAAKGSCACRPDGKGPPAPVASRGDPTDMWPALFGVNRRRSAPARPEIARSVGNARADGACAGDGRLGAEQRARMEGGGSAKKAGEAFGTLGDPKRKLEGMGGDRACKVLKPPGAGAGGAAVGAPSTMLGVQRRVGDGVLTRSGRDEGCLERRECRRELEDARGKVVASHEGPLYQHSASVGDSGGVGCQGKQGKMTPSGDRGSFWTSFLSKSGRERNSYPAAAAATAPVVVVAATAAAKVGDDTPNETDGGSGTRGPRNISTLLAEQQQRSRGRVSDVRVHDLSSDPSDDDDDDDDNGGNGDHGGRRGRSFGSSGKAIFVWDHRFLSRGGWLRDVSMGKEKVHVQVSTPPLKGSS